MDRTAHTTRPSRAVVTQATVRIQGEQSYRIDVAGARTPEATVTVILGGLLLRFLSAAAAATVLEGFASVRAAMLGVDNLAPLSTVGQGYADITMSVSMAYPAEFAVTHREAYSKARRTTVHWVDLHMGSITWQIIDHVGYHHALEVLRQAHRTAVAVCLDGGKWRADPTRDDYTRPTVR